MMTTDYNKQAADFCERFGVTITARRHAQQIAPKWSDDKKHGIRYTVTLSRGVDEVEFDFWGSIHDAERYEAAKKSLAEYELQKRNAEGAAKSGYTRMDGSVTAYSKEELAARQQAVEDCHPTAYDVLACISGDIHCPDTFEDFCAEYGYDEDSRKAEATFRRVFEFAKELRAFFATDEEREALAEIS